MFSLKSGEGGPFTDKKRKVEWKIDRRERVKAYIPKLCAIVFIFYQITVQMQIVVF